MVAVAEIMYGKRGDESVVSLPVSPLKFSNIARVDPKAEGEPQYNDGLFSPLFAYTYAMSVARDLFPDRAHNLLDVVRPAFGLVVPSSTDPKKYLYGLRSQNSTEYPLAWGLPSVAVQLDSPLYWQIEGVDGKPDPNTFAALADHLMQRKGRITTARLVPKEFYSWAGRLRGPRISGASDEYYLIFVNIKTEPIDPSTIHTTDRYTEFMFLTRKEFKDIASRAENSACGVCTAMVQDVEASRERIAFSP